MQRSRRAVAARAPEVDDLELIGRETQQEQILRLQEMSQWGQHESFVAPLNVKTTLSVKSV